MLNEKKANYAHIYKKTGVSHDTLQTVLKELVEKKLIGKEELGHKKSFYVINKKGKKYFDLLGQLREVY